MATRQERLMQLAVKLFGSHDLVREQLNALPAEYATWLRGTPLPRPAYHRLITAMIERQASRMKALRELSGKTVR